MSARQALCFVRVPQVGNREVNNNNDYGTQTGGYRASVTNDYREKPLVNITSITGRTRQFAVVTAGQILHRNEPKSTRAATALANAVIGLQEWERFVTAIDDMVEGGAYDWALERLNRIADTVEQTRRVTEDQRTAVAKIQAGQRADRA